MVLTIAAAIFVFGLLVLVHELGHFITAKLTGMRVDEFAIGFGPKLISFTYGETVYSLRAIPLGGFNDIAGMDPSNNEAGSRGYCEKPVLSRMIVILAGSIMNFILPLVIFFGIFFFVGVSTPSPEPVFGTVIEGKAAAEAGLKDGDRIISLDGKEIANWTEFVDHVKDNEGTPIKVVAQRGEETIETTMTPVYDSQAKKAMVGVMSSVDTRHPGLFEAAGLAVQKTYMIIAMMLDALLQIVLKLSGSELAGPIGVAQMAGEVAQMGFVPLLNFAAFLSLNLGIVNLFPIPALDGGHFVTLCVEAVRGKPMSPKALEYTQKVGIVLLILLMVLATKNDIVRVFTGG
ncbi:putative metalloprotease MmpA [Selenomonas ruminantium subsp. lactilytica TAM6421]|uniref:Zinc metalloprotease n=1 Tax=Selenomonas ruminantium subsp. lactilytica (strain NBRC 103574 / TAM6421) TaxID=927704 RepID=I0GNH6_SELRL|nr:RIP metalloprotease RseP [Selenomonas ruminantium]BAL82313.1 putative metalloprotease MmpA [Selenomonas ruminantium subsp. lactilytica TAM6421]